jgi:hypothetical protein
MNDRNLRQLLDGSSDPLEWSKAAIFFALKQNLAGEIVVE